MAFSDPTWHRQLTDFKQKERAKLVENMRQLLNEGTPRKASTLVKKLGGTWSLNLKKAVSDVLTHELSEKVG